MRIENRIPTKFSLRRRRIQKGVTRQQNSIPFPLPRTAQTMFSFPFGLSKATAFALFPSPEACAFYHPSVSPELQTSPFGACGGLSRSAPSHLVAAPDYPAPPFRFRVITSFPKNIRGKTAAENFDSILKITIVLFRPRGQICISARFSLPGRRTLPAQKTSVYTASVRK